MVALEIHSLQCVTLFHYTPNESRLILCFVLCPACSLGIECLNICIQQTGKQLSLEPFYYSFAFASWHYSEALANEALFSLDLCVSV